MLMALEQHQFDRLPAMPYVKGWLNQLEEAELDNIQFAKNFMPCWCVADNDHLMADAQLNLLMSSKAAFD